MCYSLTIKGTIAHKVVDLPNSYLSLPRPVKYKAGLLFLPIVPIYVGKQCNKKCTVEE